MISLSQETEALARRLADAQNVSVDAAVRHALEASVQAAGIEQGPKPTHDKSPEAVATRRARIDGLAREIAALPTLDPRSTREIVDDLNSP